MWNEPWVYLKAKIELFKNFNSFPLKKKMVYYFWISKNKYGFKFNKEKITTVMFKHYFEIVNTLRFPFLPIFWIRLAAIIFFYSLRQDILKNFELCILSGSAICYYLGYFLVTPTPDYRFIY